MNSAPPRARDLGIPFDGMHGQNNAITDVDGVCVGHQNTDDLKDPNINTGVTAILTQQNDGKPGNGSGIDTFVPAAWYALNGCGEMTGTTWIEESGMLEGPIMLTNTASVGTVRDAVIQYSIDLFKPQTTIQIDLDNFGPLLPVVAETYDGWLNDILAFKVTPDMVNGAIKNAAGGPVPEGNVGGGTGMTCYDWKGGIGTSSRIAYLYEYDHPDRQWGPKEGYTVGVLVQANQGTYWDLVIRGVPIYLEMTPPLPAADTKPTVPPPTSGRVPGRQPVKTRRKSSIIVVIATDAPLLPSQLKRLAHRAGHGIARTGTITNNDSGEIAIAFSTYNPDAWIDDKLITMDMIPNDNMDPLFEAVVQATEEAIINAMVAAKGITARGNKTQGIMEATNPTLLETMEKYHRLNTTGG
jgi:D-aminopeptidase